MTEATQDESVLANLKTIVLAFDVVFDHTKNVLFDKVTLELASLRVNAHNLYVQLQQAVKQDVANLEQKIFSDKAAAAKPVLVPEAISTEETKH